MRSKDNRKAALIREKAIEMIVKEGFDGFSMKKLADQADISPSTIYIYFDSKEDMLTKLFMEVAGEFEEDTLRDFEPSMSFEKGLWRQWKNRYRNIMKDPVRFYFLEQFRNSPRIKHEAIGKSVIRDKMKEFVKNARERNEVKALPPEVFWAMAFGPFYTLIKFHLNQSDTLEQKYTLDETKLKQAFDLVIKALKP